MVFAAGLSRRNGQAPYAGQVAQALRAIVGRLRSGMIGIIREEHAALSSMLRSILLLLAQQRTLPDFNALLVVLFCGGEFSEQRHRRKESELLFPKLRARSGG